MSQAYPVALVKLTIKGLRSFAFLLDIENLRALKGSGKIRQAVCAPSVQAKPLNWSLASIRTRMAIEACEGPLVDYLWTIRGLRGHLQDVPHDGRGFALMGDGDLIGLRQAASAFVEPAADKAWIHSRMTFEVMQVVLRVQVCYCEPGLILALHELGLADRKVRHPLPGWESLPSSFFG